MHINDRLWWLMGYPQRGRWEFVPDSAREPESIALAGRDLRRASYGLRKLRGEFPRVLPRVVGDARAWIAGVETVIRSLKPLVHDGAAPPRTLIESGLYARTAATVAAGLGPELRPLSDALSFVYATQPRRLAAAIRFISSSEAELAALVAPSRARLRLAVQCVHLGTRVGAAAIAPLLTLLADPRIDEVPLTGGAAYADAVIKPIGTGSAPRSASRPAALLGEEARGWVPWLLGREPRAIKGFLRLLAQLLAAAESQIAGRLEAALAGLVGVDEAPSWLLSDQVIRVVGAALRDRSCRKLAVLILRARCGDPPWDLRDAPANRAFLESMSARGLDVGPWLDDFSARAFGKGGRKVTLALETDPLELFHIGQHFNTCLSIASCNFYSVFANAADINKRVIYARDASGQVVGRRLVCISDSGQLVAFRAYTHTTDEDFEAHSASFIRDLAAAMHASTAPRGVISTLVSDDWYDDGSIDVAGRFEFLADGSDFREQIKTIEPDEVEALVASAVGVAEIDAVLAPMLFNLDEIRQRPALAAPLARLLRDPADIPGQTCAVIFALLASAGRIDLAGSMFATPLETHIRRSYHQQNQWLDRGSLNLLADVAPSRVLRLINELLPRGVRRRMGDDPELQVIAARCLARLHRRAKARKLLDSVIAGSDEWAIKLARDCLRDL